MQSSKPESAQMIDPSTGLPVYGMDLEIKKKMLAKRDLQKETEVRLWIEEVTGVKYAVPDDIQASLKDGVLLCKLANKILPNSVPSIATQKMPFMQMGNVNSFLAAIQKIGVKKSDLFVVIDLYEGKNIPVVVDCLFTLGGVCLSNKWKGPTIGVKRSEKTEYNFSEQQLRESSGIMTQVAVGGEKLDIGRDASRDVVKSTVKPVSNEATQWTGGSNKVTMDRDTSRDVVKSTPTVVKSGGNVKSGGDDDYALLEKLQQLKLSGIITEDEFQAKKKKILGL